MAKRVKTVYRTSEIAHIWAHQGQPFAKNSGYSFYFSGKTIYSYRDSFPLGTLFTGENLNSEVFLTTKDYGNTTSKHKSMVRHAVSHKIGIMSIWHRLNLKWII
jgi:hypothetical protein